MRLRWLPANRNSRRRKKKGEPEPERCALQPPDATPWATKPSWGRVWQRVGVQPTVPAAGTKRRVTTCGSGEVFGRGRVEVLCATQDAAALRLSLEALDVRQEATGREVFLVLDNGPCQQSQASRAALAERAEWLHVLWLARYSPHLNRQERAWRYLKRDVRSHLARSLRAGAAEILAGLRRLGGARLDSVDRVPDWFLAGQRRPPTGRPVGRPKGAKDSRPRSPRLTNLPAPT